MAAAVWLATALVLAAPVAAGCLRLFASASFLVEFLSESRWYPLTVLTRAPDVRRLAVRAGGRMIAADLYAPPSLSRPAGLVLVHGLSAQGKDDPRLREAAALLARCGWAVAVPTLRGLTVLRLRPEDADAVAASIAALSDAGYRPVAVLGISLGAGPALLAAGEPNVAGSISAVLALGGYASSVELLRYTLTGAYEFGSVRGRHPVDEAAIAQFARANAELVDAAGRRLVQNRDPRALDPLVKALPPETARLLDALSPEGRLGRLRAPLFLIHGRDDPAVPFTESLRLEAAARAAGRGVRTTIVGALGHVDPERRTRAADALRLWAAFYAFQAAAEGRW